MIKTKNKSHAAKKQPARSSRKAKTGFDYPDFKGGAEFDALSAEDKEKVWQYFEHRIPTASEQAEIRSLKKQMGRPRIGKGVKVISLSVERGLLARADAYARKHGMKRAEMVAKGLVILMDRVNDRFQELHQDASRR